LPNYINIIKIYMGRICKCKPLIWTVCSSFFDKLYLKAITPLEKGTLRVLLATFCVVFKMGTFFDHSVGLDLVSVKKTSMIWVFWFISIVQRITFEFLRFFLFDYYPKSVYWIFLINILVILISYTFERQLLICQLVELSSSLTWLDCLQIDSEGFI
jgi:hypothetical protein